MQADLEARFRVVVFTLTGALLAWALAFLVSYVFGAVACARGFAHVKVLGIGAVPLTAALVMLAALAVITFVAMRAGRTPGRDASDAHMLRGATLVVAALGAIAVLWNALPALLVAGHC